MSATTLSCIRKDMGEADAKMRNFPLQLWGIASAILGKIHLQKTYVINIVPVDPSKDLSMREVYGLSETDSM